MLGPLDTARQLHPPITLIATRREGFETRFATEEDCRDYWIKARWGGNPAWVAPNVLAQAETVSANAMPTPVWGAVLGTSGIAPFLYPH